MSRGIQRTDHDLAGNDEGDARPDQIRGRQRPFVPKEFRTPKSERPRPVSSIPAAAYLVRARIAFIMTSQTWSVPSMPRVIKNLNLPEVYIINYLDINIYDTRLGLWLER
jgi:hypothetical protein